MKRSIVDPTSHSIRASRAKPRQFKKLAVHDVPSKGAPKGGFTLPFMIAVPAGVERKLLRMTVAERTRLVELFGGFTSLDWRRFRRWICKLRAPQASGTKLRKSSKT